MSPSPAALARGPVAIACSAEAVLEKPAATESKPLAVLDVAGRRREVGRGGAVGADRRRLRACRLAAQAGRRRIGAERAAIRADGGGVRFGLSGLTDGCPEVSGRGVLTIRRSTVCARRGVGSRRRLRRRLARDDEHPRRQAGRGQKPEARILGHERSPAERRRPAHAGSFDGLSAETGSPGAQRGPGWKTHAPPRFEV